MQPTRRQALQAAALAAATVKAQPANELCFTGAVEMARLIRAKKLSAREALAAHLKQIERVNAKVNAIVTLVPELAAAAAARADEMQARKEKLGPLHGLPVAHKDLFNTRGILTTFGSPLYKDFIPTEDDIVVERIQRAGAITIGKTNTPEFGAGSQTFNKVFGATHNPYDLTKTCGGSSGGAAVALACGMVPVASGSDTGGSLRNPAAFCNVVGFRPSPGRVPNPKAAFAWSTLSTSGCLARSVADLALVLSTLAGPHPHAPLSLPEPGDFLARPLDRSFKGTRIAWFKDLNGSPFDPRVRTVIDGHRRTFESLGCIVEQAEPEFAPAETSFRILRAWNSANTYSARLHDHPDAFKDTLKAEIEEGQRLSAADLSRAETAHGVLWRGFQDFLTRYDYFVLPTTQLPPFDIATPYPTEIAGVKFESYIDWMKSCWYISATGNPAASVPAGFTPEGLPVGIQIVGRHNSDFSVLQMAHAFEQATKVGAKRPSMASLALQQQHIDPVSMQIVPRMISGELLLPAPTTGR
jgi:amidase